ncbi:DUF2721 domain-containing protein (plasmid) [Phormidium sp. CLA17]|uniref:DUF2721 domain-containing protein n=1 Tax=Leptolyngbya sp. Cla-17 TaxID=2803751 RepID=UPI00149115A5|nr:DUF2721 domain-containing protein [Leptolyngbya sp. Cla-17]MBM0745332.1 DUF2721 domain-containing protein [Leptolyngbya sp. Cla-17]
MTSETIVKAISLILAPVVMITACAILQNGLIAHYSGISNHLRSVNQEILSLSEIDLSSSPSRAAHLHDLEHLLLPDLFHRNHIVHTVLEWVYTAVLVLIVDMFAIAIAIATGISWLSQVVLIIFLLGVGMLFWSIMLVSHELHTSHRSLQIEVHHACELCQPKRRNQRH